MNREFGGRRVRTFGAGGPVIWMVCDFDLAAQASALLPEGAATVAAVEGVDWNRELTPWPAPPVARGQPDFGGNADALLGELAGRILPEVEAELRPSARWIAGYSLAGCSRSTRRSPRGCLRGWRRFPVQCGIPDFRIGSRRARIHRRRAWRCEECALRCLLQRMRLQYRRKIHHPSRSPRCLLPRMSPRHCQRIHWPLYNPRCLLPRMSPWHRQRIHWTLRCPQGLSPWMFPQRNRAEAQCARSFCRNARTSPSATARGSGGTPRFAPSRTMPGASPLRLMPVACVPALKPAPAAHFCDPAGRIARAVRWLLDVEE